MDATTSCNQQLKTSFVPVYFTSSFIVLIFIEKWWCCCNIAISNLQFFAQLEIKTAVMTRKTARYFPEDGGQELPERETSGLPRNICTFLLEEKLRRMMWFCWVLLRTLTYWHQPSGIKYARVGVYYCDVIDCNNITTPCWSMG